MDNVMKKIIDDLVKGAALAEGFVRGSRMNVELHPSVGREEKLASVPGVMGGGVLGGLGGGLGGALAGAGTGALLQRLGIPMHPNDLTGLAMLGGGVGATGGMLAGGAAGREDPSMMDRLKGAAALGIESAVTRFGLKSAGFIGSTLGSMGGGMLARKLAPGATGLMGHALEMGGSALGGAAMNKLAPPKPQGMM